MATNIVHYGINCNADISFLMPYFQEAYKTGVLHEDIADCFTIKILVGYNSDGSNRMIIDFADD
jgi:hypothetical protein